MCDGGSANVVACEGLFFLRLSDVFVGVALVLGQTVVAGITTGHNRHKGTSCAETCLCSTKARPPKMLGARSVTNRKVVPNLSCCQNEDRTPRIRLRIDCDAAEGAFPFKSQPSLRSLARLFFSVFFAAVRAADCIAAMSQKKVWLFSSGARRFTKSTFVQQSVPDFEYWRETSSRSGFSNLVDSFLAMIEFVLLAS